MSARPHCLKPAACVAKTPGKHCLACCAVRLNSDPLVAERRLAAIRAKHAEPEFRAIHAKRATARIRQYAIERGGEWLREQGHKLQQHAHTPEVHAKLRESGPRRAAKRIATILPWCPPEHLEAYRHLIRSKRLKAVDARKVIEGRMRDAALAGLDHELAAHHLRRLAPTMRCDQAGRLDPVGTHWRYGRSVLNRDEVVRLALAKGWQPERLVA